MRLKAPGEGGVGFRAGVTVASDIRLAWAGGLPSSPSPSVADPRDSRATGFRAGAWPGLACMLGALLGWCGGGGVRGEGGMQTSRQHVQAENQRQ